MKRIIQLIAIAFMLLATPAYSAQVQNITVYFDKDKAVVSAAELQKLQALKAADMVLLQGHTDDEGSETYNIALSKRRVEAIKAVIAGLDPAIKTEALSYGESKPVTGNQDEAQKQLNRRVEISWLSDPMLRIKTPVQFYEIDTRKANVLTCREGTKIEIPEGAFGDKKVLLKVSEYCNAASILSANLSTKSDAAPIESAGMIYVTAEADGKDIQPVLPLKFKFPRNNKNAGFKLFEGERSSNFEMNWKVPVAKQEVAAPAAAEVLYDTSNYIVQTLNSYYTSTITGDVFGQLNSFWDNMVLEENKSRISSGCIQGTVVDIAVNTDGRITSVKTSYTDKNTACDREVQKYIRACLPQRFKPLQWESRIQLYFDSSSARYYGSTISVSGSSTWGGGSDVTANADYEADNIVLTSANMGWINCDRFLNTATTNFVVQAEKDAHVRMVLKKYKSFFTTVYRQKENGATPKTTSSYVFNNVPLNEEALIISTRRVDGKILLAIEDAKTVAYGSFSKLNYKEVTPAELEATIKNLKI